MIKEASVLKFQIACVAFVLASSSGHAQEFSLSPVIKLHDGESLESIFENEIGRDESDLAMVGLAGAFGDFSLEFLSGWRLNQAGFAQEEGDPAISSHSDQATLSLTARYRPFSFVQIFGGIRNNDKGLDDLISPEVPGIEGLTLTIPEFAFTDIRHDFSSSFAGMVFDVPLGGGQMSLGGSINYATIIEFGRVPNAEDVLFGVSNPRSRPYREGFDSFSYQLEAGWSDVIRLSSSGYRSFSYGLDVNYAVRDQRFQQTGARDPLFSGTTVQGIAQATFHF